MTVDLSVEDQPRSVGLMQLASFLKILCKESRMRVLCILMLGE